MITNASLIFLPAAFLVCRCDKPRSLHPSRHLSEDSRARASPHSRPLVGEVDGRDIATSQGLTGHGQQRLPRSRPSRNVKGKSVNATYIIVSLPRIGLKAKGSAFASATPPKKPMGADHRSKNNQANCNSHLRPRFPRGASSGYPAHQNNTRAGTVPHSAGRYRGGRCRSVNPEGLGFNDDSREKGPRLGNWLEFGASPFIPTV